MKNRIYLTVLLLLFSAICYGQKQRMAILPSAFGGDNNIVKTICIDYLRDIPTKDNFYNRVLAYDPKDEKFADNVGKNIRYNGSGQVREMQLVGQGGGRNSKTLIIGQENDVKVADRYLTFINNTVSKYQRKLRRGKPDHNKKVLSDLQKEVWEYNVLDMLEYLNNEGAIDSDLAAGKRKFVEDWGRSTVLENLYGGRVLIIANDLKDIQSINKSGFFNVFVVTKTVNQEYVVFNGPSKPMLKTEDERKLAEFLGKYEKPYLSFENFESEAKEEALLSTLRMQLKSNGKSIAIHRYPESDGMVLFSNNYEHKLLDPLTNESIERTQIDGKPYWKTDFRITSRGETWSKTNEFAAAATDKNALESFISSTVSTFSNFSNKLSLMHFFNNFKKNLKEYLGNENEEQFILYLKSEMKDIRIVNKTRNDDIHYAVE